MAEKMKSFRTFVYLPINRYYLLSVPQRKIIHIDMDAFFASVEQRDNPELRGKPIAIGHDGERRFVTGRRYDAPLAVVTDGDGLSAQLGIITYNSLSWHSRLF